MPLRPVFVTGRPEKATEAERLGFRFDTLNLNLPEPQALDPEEVVGAKARAAYQRLSRPVLVEDSGLSIGAWGGFPGALVKWLEKSAGVEAMTRMLAPFTDRSAKAVCVVVYFDGAELYSGRGEVAGTIAPEPRGTSGFGWDPIFLPEGEDRTFGQMLPSEKDAISHRRRAWENLAASLPAGILR